MLILNLMMIVGALFTIVIFSKRSAALLPILYYGSFMILLGAFYIYFLKVGGFPTVQKHILLGAKIFFTPLANVPMSFNNLGKMMIIGRMGFVLFFFLDALNHNFYTKGYFKTRWILFVLISLPIIVFTILVWPEVFTRLFAYRFTLQRAILKWVTVVGGVYLVLGIGLYVYEYLDIRLTFYRKQHGTLTVGIIFLALQFVMFAQFEPVTIYQNYSSIHVGYSSLTFSGGSAFSYWATLLSLGTLSTIIIIFSNWRYYKYNYDREHKELVIMDKFHEASVSSSIMMHGFKNQLLSSQILLSQLAERIENVSNEEEKEHLLKITEQMTHNTDAMKNRIDLLYRSFININTRLVVVHTDALFELIQTKVQRKIPNVTVSYSIEDGIVLADIDLLSEAVYNVIINAIEAVSRVSEPCVAVSLRFLRARTLISIADNGEGISKSIRSKMFLPFNTTKNSLTNWGIGLSYSQIIIKKHLGEIRCESTSDKGTVMYITLPRYRGGAK